MNKIIESFLNTHIKEYGIVSLKTETAFEHFVNRCIINKYAIDRFDPADVMTDKGEKGLDGVAIIVNDRLILEPDDLQSALKSSNTLEVKFVFIQSKTSDSFSGSEIGDFIYGVKAFFENPESRPKTNEKMERLIALKDEIYAHSIDFRTPPVVDLYYVCCGKWDEANGLRNRINIELKPLVDSQNFSQVNFHPYDSDKITITYKELKKKISKSFLMDKRITFPAIEGVTQAFMGIVRCKDYVSILTDSDGKMLTNIFEDNVRDFQGYNSVNNEIRDTIKHADDQNRFALLNNGITIIAKTITVTGDSITIYDYQIVNGCQTSYVLFDHADELTDSSYIVIKLVEVSDEKISERVIFTTNRQTEVKAEAFTSTKPFHKNLQDYYNAIEQPYRLFYERRSKQYDLDDNIAKNRIVTLAAQVSSYLAVFLNEPHSTHRYYGELLHSYESKIFLDTDAPDVYYIASYLSFYLDDAFRKGHIAKEYKRYRYHIACAIKALEVGSQVVIGQKKQQRKEFDKLFALIKDSARLEQLQRSAVSCLAEAIAACPEVPDSDRHRSKEITKELLDRVSVLNSKMKETAYLKVGDVVHCVVTSMNASFLYVKITTTDTRNYGSIHISNASDHYIKQLTDEFSVADSFQATIKDEFSESGYGWKLSIV